MSETKRYFDYEPDYLVNPGETIEENIDHLDMSKAEFARRMGIHSGVLHRIISGEIPLSVEFAMKLESVTGVPAAFWSAMEAKYRVRLRRQNVFSAEDRKWFRAQPRKEMLEREWISGETEREQFLSALSFYRVADCQAWQKVWEVPLAAARVSSKYKVSPASVAAFVRAGEIEAESVACKPYSTEAFKAALAQCRGLAARTLTRETLLKMRQLCAEAGVALVFVKAVSGAPLNGVTRWIGKDKAMILLSLRVGREDLIWFSFFHEARHVLDEKKKTSFLTGQAWAASPEEKVADSYAAEILLPQSCDDEVVALRTQADVDRFAGEHNLAPGIVVGRYHHLTKHYAAFGKAISHFAWEENEWKVA